MATAFTPVSSNEVPLFTSTNPGYVSGAPFAFTSSGTVNLSAAAVSSRVALSGTGQTIRVVNSGANIAYINAGDSNVTASTTTSMPIMPGVTEVFGIASSVTYMAAISPLGATIYFTRGTGI